MPLLLLDCSAVIIAAILTLSVVVEASIPDTQECCRSQGVSNFCTEKLCDINNPPNEFEVFDVANRCPTYLPVISGCLADGRNHQSCCKARSRGVEEECLRLCDGTSTVLNVSNWESYKHFVACLSFNVLSMYDCLQEGYEKSPGPPQNFRVVDWGAAVIEVTWDHPDKLADRVTGYNLHYRHSSSPETEGQETLVVPFRNSYRLTGLNPDTSYKLYVTAEGSGDMRSLPSNSVTLVTKGVSPDVKAYRPLIKAVLGTTQTLVCLVELHGVEHAADLHIQWLKETHRGRLDFTYVKSSRQRHISTYSTGHRADTKHFVSSLNLDPVESNDLGLYRCVAKNNFGSARADVVITSHETPVAPATPPNVTHCCLNEGVHRECLSSCQGDLKKPLNVTRYSPSRQCATDVPKVLKCSTEGFDQGACCLRKKVPLRCLPFCDGKIPTPLPYAMFVCLLHTSDIFDCHVEAKTHLPEPPKNPQLIDTTSTTATLKWDAAASATAYQVYWRSTSSDVWKSRQTLGTSLKLQSLQRTSPYEVVILTLSDVGVSGSSKVLKFLTGQRLRDAGAVDFEDGTELRGAGRLRPVTLERNPTAR